MFPALRALVAAAAGLTLAATQTGASRFALAQILDPQGKAVVDIGPDDFVVQESGGTREVLDVRVADYPIAVVLDNSGGAGRGQEFDSMRTAVARFIDRIGVRPIAIVTSGEADRLSAAFDLDREALVGKLESIAPVDGSGQLLAAMSLAARTIADTGALFSAIVVATARPADGGSEGDPLVAPIIDSRAVVHVVHNASGANPGQQQLLRRIAEETHGGYTPIYAAASYQPALDRLGARLTTEMLIEYLVPVGSKPADVRIGVRIPGARVRGLGVAPR